MSLLHAQDSGRTGNRGNYIRHTNRQGDFEKTIGIHLPSDQRIAMIDDDQYRAHYQCREAGTFDNGSGKAQFKKFSHLEVLSKIYIYCADMNISKILTETYSKKNGVMNIR